MGDYGYISIISLFFYAFMILAFLAAKRNKIINRFICVLLAMFCWTGGSVCMRMEVWPSYIFWFHVSLAGLLMMPYCYYLFVGEFVGKRFPALNKVYLIVLAALFIGNIPGGFFLKWPDQVTEGSLLTFEYQLTPWVSAMFLAAGCVIIHIIYILVGGFRKNPGYRKQFEPIILGIVLLFAGNLALAVPAFKGFPIDILCGIINAFLMLYALIRRRLFRLKMLASESICYGIGVVLTVILFYNLEAYMRRFILGLFPGAMKYYSFLFAFFFLMASWLLTALWKCLVNNVFIKGEIRHSQRLKEFSTAVSKTLRMSDILDETIRVIAETNEVERVYICLQDKPGQEYRACCSDRPLNDLSFSLRDDHPIVSWLRKTEDCLMMKDFRSTVEYKSMWEEEKKLISGLGVECCIGLRQNEQLAGIVILANASGKHTVKLNSLDLLSSVSSVASIAIKNARLYETAFLEARTDELTGLLNRKYFYEILDEEFEKNKEGSLALILMNIDDFKLYNQLYGNHQGDIALKEVAGLIRASVGERGFAARYSAKEFAILLPKYDVFSARTLAESIRRQIANMSWDSPEYKLKVLTVSVGISAAPYAAKTVKELLDNADLAVYHVKRNGKNGVEIFDTMLRESLTFDSEKPTDHAHIYQEYESTIYALTAAIDTKDHYTFSHSNNVAYYATSLAKALNYTSDMVEIVRQAALLHDVGKIGIPENILNKKGKLTDEEYDVMKGHVEASIGIIRHLPSLDYVIPAVIGHHERYDGKGYPRRIAGEDIPESARILCIADSFDAMTSKRCYKEVVSVPQALKNLDEEAGKQFDPYLAQVFIKCVREGKIRQVSMEDGEL